MNQATAELLMSRIAAMNEAHDHLAEAIETISDEAERKQYRRAMATLTAESYMQIVLPLRRQFPDLDPARHKAEPGHIA